MKTLIPQKQTIIGYERELKILNHAVKENIATLLIGETGVGKTSLIRHLANTGKHPLRRVNLNGQTTVDEFVGKTLLNKEGTFWQDGVLVEAMRNGFWLVLDEVNAALPEILFVLHSLLDDDRYVVLSEKDGEVVTPHKDFRIFATMNPSGRYAGTKDLNKAFLSRFPIVLNIDFPPDEQEKAILKHYTSLNPDQIMSLVKTANNLRQAYEKDEIEYVCSTRDLINCGLLVKTFGMREAIDLAIVAKVNGSDKSAVNTVVDLYFGRKGEAKAKDIQNNQEVYINQLEDYVKNSAENINYIALNSINLYDKRLSSAVEIAADRFINNTAEMIEGIKMIQFNDLKKSKDIYALIGEADLKIKAHRDRMKVIHPEIFGPITLSVDSLSVDKIAETYKEVKRLELEKKGSF